MKQLADSIIPPQLSSAILGDAIQEILRSDDLTASSKKLTALG